MGYRESPKLSSILMVRNYVNRNRAINRLPDSNSSLNFGVAGKVQRAGVNGKYLRVGWSDGVGKGTADVRGSVESTRLPRTMQHAPEAWTLIVWVDK